MVFVQRWPFFQLLFFLGKRDQEKSFYDILERKNAFRGYKKKQVKKVEKLPFFHGFGPKLTIFATSFF